MNLRVNIEEGKAINTAFWMAIDGVWAIWKKEDGMHKFGVKVTHLNIVL